MASPCLEESQAVGLLQHLNQDELQRLLDNEDKLNDLIKDLPQIRNILTEKEMVEASNKSLAEYNLSREPRLQAAREKLANTYRMAQELRAEVEGEKCKLDEKEGPQSLDTVLALLQASAAETEEKSEELATEFLSGNVGPETFIETFIPVRVEANLKAIKSDKLRELLQENGY